MDICGEHGAEMAFIGRYCPACSQIDEIKEEHDKVVDELSEAGERDYNRIRELEDELHGLKEGTE